MNCRMPNADRRMGRRTSFRPRGFSFTEILFAVMILGIGFIMIAAMFPVAIRQTEAGSQETIAAAVGRSSSNFLGELAASPIPLPANTSFGGYTPGSIATTQLPSILLPTMVMANAGAPATPPYVLPPAGMFTLPAGHTSMVVPGQVWTMLDSRDLWYYTVPGGARANHNVVLWQSVARNLILPGDMRFGWAAMYRRDAIVSTTPTGNTITPATFAQVIVIGMQARNKQTYDPAVDLNTTSTTVPPTPFIPQRVGTLNTTNGLTITGNGVNLVPAAFAGGPTYIDFSKTGGLPAMLAENVYVVISDDNVPWNKASHGALNGRVLRVGSAPTGAATAWPLLPGSDLTASDLVALTNMTTDLGGTPPQFNVLIVGRTPGTGGTYSGPAQDVTAYTTYLPVAN